jgi:DNA-binding response OmpR family regulator
VNALVADDSGVIRSSAGGERVPVVVLSSGRADGSVLLARELGVQEFVLEPVSPEVLRDRVGLARTAWGVWVGGAQERERPGSERSRASSLSGGSVSP